MRLFEEGFRPRTDIAHFIEWDRREFNSLADHAANCALDLQSSCEMHEESAVSHFAYLRMCVDGARRGSGQASGGLAILAYTGSGHAVELYRAGTCFGVLDSAFSSEVYAMEWALEHIWKLLAIE